MEFNDERGMLMVVKFRPWFVEGRYKSTESNRNHKSDDTLKSSPLTGVPRLAVVGVGKSSVSGRGKNQTSRANCCFPEVISVSPSCNSNCN